MTAAPFNTNPATMNVDPAASFPCRLHRMLTDIDHLSQSDVSMAHLPSIISWSEDGKSFKIHDRKKFIDTVMPIFFSRLKYSSFVRGVSGHGFTRLRCQGPTNGAMFHPNFNRDEPQLASTIEKIKKKSKAEMAKIAASRPSRRSSENSLGSTSTGAMSTCSSNASFSVSQLTPKAPKPQPTILDESLFSFIRQDFTQANSSPSHSNTVWPVALPSSMVSTTCHFAQQSPLPVEEKKQASWFGDASLSEKFASLSNGGCGSDDVPSCNSSVEESILADLDLPGDDFACPWDLEPLPLR